MKYLSIEFIRSKNIGDYGFFLFVSGIFFLSSSLFISILFLLPAGIIGSLIQKKSYLKDKWNYPFCIFALLIFISSLLQNFAFRNIYEEIWDPILSIIGLGNWIPFIWLFWAFQPYLNKTAKRRLIALTLVAGTFPVLITGLGQFYFNWTGPFETLNGLIVWYQRPIVPPGGLSGLFNNQNYTGAWLNFVWPFCLAFILERDKNIYRKTVALSFLISVGFAAFLTYSRNAWLGLLISMPIMLNKKWINHFLIILMLITFTALLTFSSVFPNEILYNLSNLIPEKIFLEFSPEGYAGLDATRIEIFKSGLDIIKSHPIFGIGASSFSAIYQLETSFWKGHSHNLFIELAISYGLPATIILLIAVSSIIFLSGKQIFTKKRIQKITPFDRAFWVAILFFLISQTVDIQYFDGKISLIAWILLAGLKNIIEDNNFDKLESY